MARDGDDETILPFLAIHRELVHGAEPRRESTAAYPQVTAPDIDAAPVRPAISAT